MVKSYILYTTGRLLPRQQIKGRSYQAELSRKAHFIPLLRQVFCHITPLRKHCPRCILMSDRKSEATEHWKLYLAFDSGALLTEIFSFFVLLPNLANLEIQEGIISRCLLAMHYGQERMNFVDHRCQLDHCRSQSLIFLVERS